LQSDSPATIIAMANKRIGGLEAPAERDRFKTDVIPAKPDLVIWQVGTNAIWQRRVQKPPPPTIDETICAIREGLTEFREETESDIILMDLQYVPAVLTPSKKEKALAMVEAIGRLRRKQTSMCFSPLRFHAVLARRGGYSDRLHG
jgi:hypothetical protein